MLCFNSETMTLLDRGSSEESDVVCDVSLFSVSKSLFSLLSKVSCSFVSDLSSSKLSFKRELGLVVGKRGLRRFLVVGFELFFSSFCFTAGMARADL